jgi:hypothetical protein
MGTTSEWIQALLLGELWGASMMLWYAYRRHSENLKPTWRGEEVLTWALMGLWFGIVTTFHWRRAFHTPIVFVTVSAFASACVIGVVGGKRRSMK